MSKLEPRTLKPVGRGSRTPPTPDPRLGEGLLTSPDTDLRSPVSARSETCAEQSAPQSKGPPELFQIVVECAGEAEQRTLFDRLRAEGLKLRLLVL
jgi:hypothetical protein